MKLSHLIHVDKMNLQKLYEEMEQKAKLLSPNNPKVDLNIFEQQIKKHYGDKMQER
jgi:hypothetical protein